MVRPLLTMLVISLVLVQTVTAQDAGTPAVQPERFDVGGYKLTLLKQGHGGIPIVVEVGSGYPAVEGREWDGVCAELAKSNLVVRYDRAGLGGSDPPAKSPRTVTEMAEELHRLLTAADVPRPFVLVAHSMGGLVARAYADAHPEDLAGLVLSDSSHPHQEERWLEALPELSPENEKVLKPVREFLQSRVDNRGDNMDQLDYVASRDQVDAFRPLGDLPLAVITHSPEWKMAPELPAEYLAPLEAMSQQLQVELSKLSSNSTHTIAKRAGHAIHVDEPELVVSATREVLAKAAARKQQVPK